MTPYLRNWIRFCSLGLALAVFAGINLDTTSRPVLGTQRGFYRPDFAERFTESLLALPIALLGGALWGAILGAGVESLVDVWHRLWWTTGLFRVLSGRRRKGP
jgi:hypothetical protein